MVHPNVTFQSFNALGEPRLALRVTPQMLPAQRHLLSVIDSIERVMASGGRAWQLHLQVEDTEPFNVEFSRIGNEAAVVRFLRNDMDWLLILLADATGGRGHERDEITKRIVNKKDSPRLPTK